MTERKTWVTIKGHLRWRTSASEARKELGGEGRKRWEGDLHEDCPISGAILDLTTCQRLDAKVPGLRCKRLLDLASANTKGTGRGVLNAPFLCFPSREVSTAGQLNVHTSRTLTFEASTSSSNSEQQRATVSLSWRSTLFARSAAEALISVVRRFVSFRSPSSGLFLLHFVPYYPLTFQFAAPPPFRRYELLFLRQGPFPPRLRCLIGGWTAVIVIDLRRIDSPLIQSGRSAVVPAR